MTDIGQAKVLIVATHGFEQSERAVPRDQPCARGATVDVATPDGRPIRGWEGADWGREAEADLAVADADSTQPDALVIPGGRVNPDLLRVEAAAIALVKAFDSAGKPIAAVCHGPWVLAEAGLCGGRGMTSSHSIRTDIWNAGAEGMDSPVVQDRNIITARNPGDRKDFVGKIVEDIETRRPSHRAA